MKNEQIIKLLKVAIYCTLIMFAFEVLFMHSAVTNFLTTLVESSGAWAYIVIWLIMFLQVCIVPIPAYVVLVGAVNTSLITTKFLNLGLIDVWFYLTTLSAYMVGCAVAYFLGYKWGKKAVKWVAGNDSEYEKWSTLINKKGKIWYALTVLFPIFPDDLLCVVCGAIKFEFGFFMIANFICRTIGLFFMVEFLKLVGMMNNNGFPWSVLIWGIALLLEIIMLYIFKFKTKGERNDSR
jgi:uncharacterized membrane protein YdjX (TVP38/TMEM64 family)